MTDAARNITKRVMFEFNAMIEDRITELMISHGCVLSDMRLDHESGPSGPTAVLRVRGARDSKFWIENNGLSFTINCERDAALKEKS